MNIDDRLLCNLYGGEENARCQRARLEKMETRFHELFPAAKDMHLVSAPGRAEIAGNHTDHQFGRVLAAAVNLDTIAAVSATGDSIVTLYSDGYEKPFVVDVSDLSVHAEEKETTHALIRGVAACLKEAGYRIGGFNAYVTSTVFKGSGLSSSAAFEVMLVAANDALFNGWTIDPKENAKLSQKTENRYFGKPSGLLDQMASAVGGLVTIDFENGGAKVEALSYDFSAKGYALCVVAAGGEHGNLTGEYAAIPAEMKQVAQALGGNFLREVEDKVESSLAALKNKVPDRAILRALHFIDEDRRVPKLVDALRQDRLDDFFAGIIASGESSWKLLQNLCVAGSANQEMPLALEISRRMLTGKGAWRIHGGGFAGTILAFVPVAMRKEYQDTMDGLFGAGATTVLRVRPVGAVQFQ